MIVVGAGGNLKLAIDNGLQRASELFGMSVPEVMNRVTITGAVEKLKEKGLWELVRDQYHLYGSI